MGNEGDEGRGMAARETEGPQFPGAPGAFARPVASSSLLKWKSQSTSTSPRGQVYINISPRHLLSRLQQLFCFTLFSSFSSRFKRKELREKTARKRLSRGLVT